MKIKPIKILPPVKGEEASLLKKINSEFTEWHPEDGYTKIIQLDEVEFLVELYGDQLQEDAFEEDQERKEIQKSYQTALKAYELMKKNGWGGMLVDLG